MLFYLVNLGNPVRVFSQGKIIGSNYRSGIFFLATNFWWFFDVKVAGQFNPNDLKEQRMSLDDA